MSIIKDKVTAAKSEAAGRYFGELMAAGSRFMAVIEPYLKDAKDAEAQKVIGEGLAELLEAVARADDDLRKSMGA